MSNMGYYLPSYEKIMQNKLLALFTLFAQATKHVNREDPPKVWEDYNANIKIVSVEKASGKFVNAVSYTDDIFDSNNLYPYFNDQKSILQIGASTGKFLKKYKNLNWNVTAYDYSKSAIKELKEIGVNAYKIDLDSLTSDRSALSYVKKLRKDLSKPTNIILVRILQYLQPYTAHLLMLELLNAAPGSVIFIAGHTNKKQPSENNMSPDAYNNFITSYFGASTKVTFFQNKNVNHGEQLLVVGINKEQDRTQPETAPACNV